MSTKPHTTTAPAGKSPLNLGAQLDELACMLSAALDMMAAAAELCEAAYHDTEDSTKDRHKPALIYPRQAVALLTTSAEAYRRLEVARDHCFDLSEKAAGSLAR